MSPDLETNVLEVTIAATFNQNNRLVALFQNAKSMNVIIWWTKGSIRRGRGHPKLEIYYRGVI